LAAAIGVAKNECYDFLRAKYDGYHFATRSPGVYNPVSLMTALMSRSMESYWAETDTPSILVDWIASRQMDLTSLQDRRFDIEDLSKVDSYNSEVIPMMYQCGYLTIAQADEEGIRLDFPNEDVKKAFLVEVNFSSLKRNIDSWNVEELE